MSYVCAYAAMIESKYISEDFLFVGGFKSRLDSSTVNANYFKGGFSVVKVNQCTPSHNIEQVESAAPTHSCVIISRNATQLSRQICYKGIPKCGLKPIAKIKWEADSLNHKMKIYANGVIRYKTELFSFIYDVDACREQILPAPDDRARFMHLSVAS
jgi:hypothetical protein